MGCDSAAYEAFAADLAARAAYQASVPISRLSSSHSTQGAGPGAPAAFRSQQFSGAALAAPSSSLEERTLNASVLADAPYFAVKLKDFGEGRVVAVGLYVNAERRQGGHSVRISDVGAASIVERPLVGDRFERSVRRSKAILRDRVWMLRADRMLTLTKRGRFDDLDQAWVAWNAFRKLARRFWGERFAFVVVPEPHKAGGFHLHVALRGFYDVGMLRRLWSRALGGTGHESGGGTLGNVDITHAVSSPRSRVRIASYLSKYLGKDLGSLLRGRRALAASRGIPAPRVVRWFQAVELGRSPIGAAMRRIRDVVDSRLEGLHWWEWSCGALHGFGITPLF